MKPTILLLESIAPPADALLRDHAHVIDADAPNNGLAYVRGIPIKGIVTRGKGKVDSHLLDACEGLRVVARCGVGLDNVDVAHASKLGIAVLNAPGSNSASVAEHTLALILMLQRNMAHAVREVQQGNWGYRASFDGDDIRGKRIGILGFGNIGQRVARLASAFNLTVNFWDVRKIESAYEQVTLDTLVRTADILTIHLPLLAETRHLITLELLQKAERRPLLINTARGGIVQDDVVLQALQQGYLSGFGADVLEVSPPPAGYPLLAREDVLVTPHAASLTRTTYEDMCRLSVENTLALLSGKEVDPAYIFNSAAGPFS